MITFPFSYDILDNDDTTNTMVVRYSAEGLETLDISMPYPQSDVNIDDHLIRHAPEFHWVTSKKTYTKVSKGTKGTVTPVGTIPVLPAGVTPPDLSPQDIANLVNQLKKA